MQLQFQPTVHSCMQRVTWEVKNEEQTQEVRLPEAMPDAAQVLACWGQVVVRSKEWRGNGMSVSGGVMAWILYTPEGGMQAESIETWIPFQIRWDFPQTQHDGAIVASCLLRSIDARLVSARKLMLRTVLSAAGEALEPGKVEVYDPIELPEDIHIRKACYPVNLCKEAGEATFLLDEMLSWPPDVLDAEKLVYYHLFPEITEKKIMADKVVFRGTAHMQALCQCGDGQLKTCQFQFSFSQFAELEREYGPDAQVQILPAVTSLELERQEDGTMSLKAGMVGQYTVYDRAMLDVVEDAYSLKRPLTLETQPLTVLSVLENQNQAVEMQQQMDVEAMRAVDGTMFLGQPQQRRSENGVSMEIPGTFQLLYRDEDGHLQSKNQSWEHTDMVDAAEQTELLAMAVPMGFAKATLAGTDVQMRGDTCVALQTEGLLSLPMVTGMEIGEAVTPDPNRPSLILRRPAGQSLWEIAKESGSTVDLILGANQLTEEPLDDRLLMIPVV